MVYLRFPWSIIIVWVALALFTDLHVQISAPFKMQRFDEFCNIDWWFYYQWTTLKTAVICIFWCQMYVQESTYEVNSVCYIVLLCTLCMFVPVTCRHIQRTGQEWWVCEWMTNAVYIFIFPFFRYLCLQLFLSSLKCCLFKKKHNAMKELLFFLNVLLSVSFYFIF